MHGYRFCYIILAALCFLLGCDGAIKALAKHNVNDFGHGHFHHHLVNRRHHKPHLCIQQSKEEVIAVMNRMVSEIKQFPVSKGVIRAGKEGTTFFDVPRVHNHSWYTETLKFHELNHKFLDSTRVIKPAPHLRFDDGLGFYANDNLDVLVFNAFFKKGHAVHWNGTYLETGGSNGIHASNTLFFSDFLGWRGLLIEPTACALCQLPKNRPFDKIYHAGICTTATTFDAKSMNGLCPIGQRGCNVNLRYVGFLPTRDIINASEVDVIDLMSIDVESHFMDVLTSIDWVATQISVLIVECGSQECFDFLEQKGYEVIKPEIIDGITVDVIAWKNGCYGAHLMTT
jgi:hypothetical protein